MPCILYCVDALGFRSGMQKALCERQTQAVKLLSFVPLRIKETQPLAVEIDT